VNSSRRSLLHFSHWSARVLAFPRSAFLGFHSLNKFLDKFQSLYDPRLYIQHSFLEECPNMIQPVIFLMFPCPKYRLRFYTFIHDDGTKSLGIPFHLSFNSNPPPGTAYPFYTQPTFRLFEIEITSIKVNPSKAYTEARNLSGDKLFLKQDEFRLFFKLFYIYLRLCNFFWGPKFGNHAICVFHARASDSENCLPGYYETSNHIHLLDYLRLPEKDELSTFVVRGMIRWANLIESKLFRKAMF